MDELPHRHVFFAKMWIRWAAAMVWTPLAVFCIVLGPLCLFGLMKDVNGQPAQDAGIALTIMTVPMLLVSALLWFNILARRKPLLRICHEGIEVNVIGSSSLDGIPLLPNMARIAWLIVSLQGFKKQIGWIPWRLLRAVHVSGPPMYRALEIYGTVVYPEFAGDEIKAKVADSIAFRDAEFRDPLEEIAGAIRTFYAQPQARESLPSLVQ